jgi:hypothetical protein
MHEHRDHVDVLFQDETDVSSAFTKALKVSRKQDLRLTIGVLEFLLLVVLVVFMY